jgi:hypothetical protein
MQKLMPEVDNNGSQKEQQMTGRCCALQGVIL